MNQISTIIRSNHPTVWFLLVGTVLTRISQSMTLPFLALYLSKLPNMSPALIGVVIGAASFTSVFTGFIGGNLSDKLGRRKVMLFAMLFWGIIFWGFGLTKSIAIFFGLSALNGLCRSFFEPTSQAMMADLTPPEHRQRIFAMRYMAINMGASVGPLLGVYLGITSTTTTFFLTGSVFMIYGLGIFLWVKESHYVSNPLVKKVSSKEAIEVLVRDGALVLFLVAGMLINLGYSQVESTLPQYMEQIFKEQGANYYSWIITLNAITVVTLQIPVAKLVQRITPMRQMMYGAFLFAAGYAGFAVFTTLPGLMGAMIVLTIGEILVMPAGMVFLDRIAPDHLRGSYFGVNSLRNLGFSIGPGFGGWLMTLVGPPIMFLTIGGIVLITVLLYIAGNSIYLKREEKQLNLSQ